MHPTNIEFDRERTVTITFTNEADQVYTMNVIPRCITFGRGAWWLEATNDEANVYVRIRMSRITHFQRAS